MLRKSIWDGLRFWSLISIAIVVICIMISRKKMDEIEA